MVHTRNSDVLTVASSTMDHLPLRRTAVNGHVSGFYSQHTDPIFSVASTDDESEDGSLPVRKSKRSRRPKDLLSSEDVTSSVPRNGDVNHRYEKRERTGRSGVGITPTRRTSDEMEAIVSSSGRPIRECSRRVRIGDGPYPYEDFSSSNQSGRKLEASENRVEPSDNSGQEDDETEQSRGYNLRAERKPAEVFQIAPAKKKARATVSQFFQKRRKKKGSPSPKRRRHHRKTSKFHDSDSTSSSSNSSDDERKFVRRQSKSMKKRRQQLMPMNVDISDLTHNQKNRQAIGSSLADIDPMSLDKSVSFSSIGGLSRHIRALKEMVLLPNLYPDLFSKFSLKPPRGCLFYGPPGTGKTLVARALANECSGTGPCGRKIAFFMRKGADCLSKWVGESERQLRLLFDQAYQMRPSIIFFDEIDGLAPVRSSRQDQIHSSIVSTLLALMDGLDCRGEIIVIGATNRIDSIDPALRRPGRFDREFLFTLPDEPARKEILHICTDSWSPKIDDSLIEMLAKHTVGYSGADLKSLCMEAAMIATRRRYPQIYLSNEQLKIDLRSVKVEQVDLFNAMRNIRVSTFRVSGKVGKPLENCLRPLLGNEVSRISEQVLHAHQCSKLPRHAGDSPFSDIVGDLILPREGSSYTFDTLHQLVDPHVVNFVTISETAAGQCLSSHIAPAVIDAIADVPVLSLTLTALMGDPQVPVEQAASHVIKEALRLSPSVLYIPNITHFFNSIDFPVRSILGELFSGISTSGASVLVLSTKQFESPGWEDFEGPELFMDSLSSINLEVSAPGKEDITRFFAKLFDEDLRRPPIHRKLRYPAVDTFEVVRKPGEEVQSAPLNKTEMSRLRQRHSAMMRELRILLREVLTGLAKVPEYRCFVKPVDREDVEDYYDVIEKPMDMTTMMTKTDAGEYKCVKQFLADISLIAENALEYNPVSDPQSQRIRHRACAFRDSAASMIRNEIDTDFEDECEQVYESFKARGDEIEVEVPKFFHTLPKERSSKASKKSCSKYTLRSSQPPSFKQIQSQGIVDKYRRQQKRKFDEIRKITPHASPVKKCSWNTRRVTKSSSDELKSKLSEVLTRLGKPAEYRVFSKPVDKEEVEDYYDVIKKPMDLSTMRSKLESGGYAGGPRDFLEDLNLIADNALEYNPVTDPKSLRIREKAEKFREACSVLMEDEFDVRLDDERSDNDGGGDDVSGEEDEEPDQEGTNEEETICEDDNEDDLKIGETGDAKSETCTLGVSLFAVSEGTTSCAEEGTESRSDKTESQQYATASEDEMLAAEAMSPEITAKSSDTSLANGATEEPTAPAVGSDVKPPVAEQGESNTTVDAASESEEEELFDFAPWESQKEEVQEETLRIAAKLKVSEMIRLHSLLRQRIFRHLDNHDKTALMSELRETIAKFDK